MRKEVPEERGRPFPDAVGMLPQEQAMTEGVMACLPEKIQSLIHSPRETLEVVSVLSSLLKFIFSVLTSSFVSTT